MNNLNGIYHKLRKMQPKAARTLVRDILNNNSGNVSLTAKILGISRITIRRARDGSLEDMSRRPKNIPNRTPFEDLILNAEEETHYRYRLLSKFIKLKYGFDISENTIKAVLKRRKIKGKRIRTSNGNVRHLYDYEHLTPFIELQMDTKYILDKKALPKDVYDYILENNLPIFEWNVIDACTRTRFTAYSYQLSAEYGFSFIMIVLLWLRTHNVKEHIRIQLDNGSEFCKGSKKKENQWNELFSLLNAHISPIPIGAKHLQGIVENSHRVDDQSFLSIHPIRCNTVDRFIEKAQQWQDTWNTARPSFGIDMDGMTPYEKFKKKNIYASEHVFNFPVFLMETLISKNGSSMQWLYRYLGLNFYSMGGKYVYTTCHIKLSK
ncbi:IS481 family transposase [candidate division WOR-3 bacterium]|nr:IS481 family transposase [candidate division WOR-3 bacterium]